MSAVKPGALKFPEYYANAFPSLRKKDPLARVEIIPPSNPSDPKNSPLFQMTLSDGKNRNY